MNEFINCSLCNYKSTGLRLLSSWRDKVETHKVPVVLPNLVKAIFVHTSGTSSLFLSESLGAIFFLLLCFPCCFYQDGWSTAIKVLPSVWDSEFLITCFAAFLVRFSICLLSLITWNTPLVFVLKGYLFNFTKLCEFSLPSNSGLSNLHSPCLIKSRNEGESAWSGETKQRLQRWLCLK